MILFKAIGICYFVLSNYYESPFIWLPIQSFLAAYFFFLVGYHFKTAYGFVDKLNFIREKAELYMLFYFVYNIIFALIRIFINLNFQMTIMGPYPTFFNFFIEPFLENRIYPLSGSTWFYPQLFLTLIIVQLIYYNKQQNIYIDVIYLISTIISFTIAIQLVYSKNDHSPVQIIFVRTLFSLVFIFLGYIYHQYLESKLDKQLFTSFHCFIEFVLLVWIINIYPDIKYNYVKADFHHHPFWVPLIIGCSSIYIHLFVCHALEHVIDENDLLYTIAKESYHIMFLHGISFLLVNLIILKYFLDMDNHVLDVSYRYKSNMTWPFYFAAGIKMPILFIKYARLLRHIIQR
jgi:hypothetical protein